MQAVLSVATLPLRGYLTELILEQLSYFIRKECLNVDQLTIGGDLVLHNLELKLDVLRETLGVPLTFDISRGFIKRLSVSVPWTNLFGQPIEVLFDTILIVIRSKTEAEMKHTAHTTCQNIDSIKTTVSSKVDVDSPNDNKTIEPSGIAGIADEWTRAVLAKILANTSITIRDLIFKYEAPSGPTVMVTLRTFKCFSTGSSNNDLHWSEPEGDERFMEKVAIVDDLTVSLSRYDHTLRGSSDRPIISRATISARARFALNPLHRDVVDYSVDTKPNPFAPHYYIEIFVPFLEANITQTQVDMMELIHERALQSEQELAKYVVEAQAAAAMQMKLLEEVRIREAREREERRKNNGLSNPNPGDNDIDLSVDIDLTHVNVGNSQEENSNQGLEDAGNNDSMNNSSWSQWAWDVLLGEDEILDDDEEGINTNAPQRINDISNLKKNGLAATNIDLKSISEMSNSSKAQPDISKKSSKKTGATYTLIEFSAEYIALSLLLQDDMHIDKSAHNASGSKTHAVSTLRKTVTPIANNSHMLASNRLKVKLQEIQSISSDKASITTPKRELIAENVNISSTKRKMQVPTPRGIVEIEYDDGDDDSQQHACQFSLIPVVTFIFSTTNLQLRFSKPEADKSSVTNILIDLDAFAATDGNTDKSKPFILWGGQAAVDTVKAFFAVKNRSRSLSDVTPPPSPRIFDSRRKQKQFNGSIFSDMANTKPALFNGKINIYEEQVSFEGEAGKLEFHLSPQCLRRIRHFFSACKNTASDVKASKALNLQKNKMKPDTPEPSVSKGSNEGDKENDGLNTVNTSNKSIICFATLSSLSISLYDVEHGREIVHCQMQDFHLHYGKKSSSLMFNRIQVDVEPGIVFLSIERPALGINIVYEGVGIETVMLDVGNVMVDAKAETIAKLVDVMRVNLKALYGDNIEREALDGSVASTMSNESASPNIGDENAKLNTIKNGYQNLENPKIDSGIEEKKWYYPSLGSVEVSRVNAFLTTNGVTGASISFAAVRLSNIRRSSKIMIEELWAHYAADALLAIPGLFGSVDAIGNPSSVIRELSGAFEALGEGKGATAVKEASGALLIPMQRIFRSIKNAAEGVSFGPASGFVVAPIRKLAEAIEGIATGGREALGVDLTTPKLMRDLKAPNFNPQQSTRSFKDEELRGMPMLMV